MSSPGELSPGEFSSFENEESDISLVTFATDTEDEEGSLELESCASILEEEQEMNIDELCEEEENDERPLSANYYEPLFDGAKLTVIDSYMKILKYSLRHSLTKQALSDLLTLVDDHLPVSSMESLHTMRKLFLRLYEDITFQDHYCCFICQSPLKEPTSSCRHECGADSVIEFLQIHIEPQLRRRFQDPVFWNNIQKRLSTPRDLGTSKDLYDGDEYRKNGDFLSHPTHISFTLNTDGAQLFHSSSVSLWPIWLVINELPPQVRFSKDNVILAGIWFSSEKPRMTTYLEPVISEINKLSSEGFTVKTPDGRDQTVKTRLLLCSLDLPARAIVMNMKQFNGEFGCCYCEDKGVPRPTNSLHRNWPYQSLSIPRTHASILSNARNSHRNSQMVPRNRTIDKGIKGASALTGHHHFDLGHGFVIDYMHCVCLGVVAKTLMSLWLSQSRHAEPFNIRRKLKQCDDRLKNISVPHDFSRVPRPLSRFKLWKASEYRSWLLYYSLPVLQDILPDPYYTHYSLLVAAMHIMLGKSISPDSLRIGEEYLRRFYEIFSTLYGDNACTMNVHMLRHIGDCVRNWGPLWAYSCFSFESQNGHLKKLYHGTRCMNRQLGFSYILLQVLPNNPVESDHFRHLSDCTLLGNSTLTPLSSEVRQAVHTQFQVDAPSGSMFSRVRLKGVVYHSQAYTRTKQRNSYSVAYIDNDVVKLGFIQSFISLRSFTVAVIEPLVLADHHCCSSRLTVLHRNLIPVVSAPSPVVVPVIKLLEKCVCVTVDGKIFLVRQPNPFYYFD